MNIRTLHHKNHHEWLPWEKTIIQKGEIKRVTVWKDSQGNEWENRDGDRTTYQQYFEHHIMTDEFLDMLFLWALFLLVFSSGVLIGFSMKHSARDVNEEKNNPR